MKLTNLTRKSILTQDLKEAKSISDKILGLHLKNNPRSLLFKTRFGIHTFFLKEPIDVIVLDNALRVVKAQTVNPNSLFFYNPINFTVLELPKGTVQKTRTIIGDHLAIK